MVYGRLDEFVPHNYFLPLFHVIPGCSLVRESCILDNPGPIVTMYIYVCT